MTQLGEGRGAGYSIGAPASGEILAERYQLEQHINTDSAGRQIWRGVDIILRRPVAVVIRYPGGPAAHEMLQTAVEASRIVHPNLVGVYDAIDEQSRAYVVREWVDGASLREHITMGAFDGTRAVAVVHAVAAAVTAVHSTGMTHGNIHPGTVMIGLDGRVVLADAHADGAAPAEEDIRAVGAVLYFALTGYWPHAEVAGPASLPDAMRDGAGALAAPRQVRAGVPDHLDNLTMDLLDRRLPVPTPELLTGEFARLDANPEFSEYSGEFGGAGLGTEAPFQPDPGGGGRSTELQLEPERSSGPIRFRSTPPEPPSRPSGRRLVLGLGGLVVVGIIGLLVGLNMLISPSEPSDESNDASGSASTTEPSAGGEQPTGDPEPIPINADQVRIVDPPTGDRTELADAGLVVDDDLSTGWRTDGYNSAEFGNLKPGMGILINLGEPKHVDNVQVELGIAGATAEMRVGQEDPGDSAAGDDEIYQTYEPVGDPQEGGTTMVFSAFDPEQTYQYLMVWFSELAPGDDGRYRVEVNQVAVEGY